MYNIDKKTMRIVVFVAFIALMHSLLFIFVFKVREPLSGDGHYYDRIAWNFAQGRGLLDYYQKEPLIYKTPMYMFIGLIYFLFGHSLSVVLIIQSVLYSVSCIILYFIARDVCGKQIGFLVSLSLALYFPLVQYTAGIITEILCVFLTLLVVLFWIKYTKTAHKKFIILSGIFLGLNILCKPFLAFFPIPLLIYLFWQKTRKIKVYIAVIILFASICFTIVPWVIRNYLVFQEFIVLSKGNAEDQLLHGVLDFKYSLWDWDFWYDKWNDPRRKDLDLFYEKIQAEIKTNPFVNKRDLYLREIRKLIANDPLRYVKGRLVGIVKLWINYPSRMNLLAKVCVIGFDSVLFILAVIGFIVARSQWKQLSIFWLPLVYVTLVYLPFHIEGRYSAPMRPFFMVFVSIGIVQIFHWLLKLKMKMHI